MRGLLVSLIAVSAIITAFGCGKKEETTTITKPSTTTGGTPTTTSSDSVPMPDFSTDEKAAATVLGALNNDAALAGTTLKVEAKDKMIHIMGDVKSNDQKRKIDEITKSLESPAQAAGYKFMNMAIVKG